MDRPASGGHTATYLAFAALGAESLDLQEELTHEKAQSEGNEVSLNDELKPKLVDR